MADKPASERTEKATPERLRKARQEGQIPESREVPSAVMIVVLLGGLMVMGGRILTWLVGKITSGLENLHGEPASAAFANALSGGTVELLTIMTPLLALMAGVSCLGSLAVGGWTFAAGRIKPDLKRISPVNGLKNLFSLKSLVKLVISVIKLAVILLIAWWYLRAKFDTMLAMQWTTPSGVISMMGEMVVGLVGRVAVALGVIAIVDFLYQKWNYKRQLRMTRQEIKDERRQHELAPEVKSRIRSSMTAIARKRMLQEVPAADVVVTNPTHYAVALKYDSQHDAAPVVVAKGADLLSVKIKEIAAAHDVPIVERPHLARVLYAAVEPGGVIPENLFVAVAEVLAMIYRMRKQRGALSGTGENNA